MGLRFRVTDRAALEKAAKAILAALVENKVRYDEADSVWQAVKYEMASGVITAPATGTANDNMASREELALIGQVSAQSALAAIRGTHEEADPK